MLTGKTPDQRRIMAGWFIAYCTDKFERRAREKNKTVEPWKDSTINHLTERLLEEVNELFDAIMGGNPEHVMDECKDVANFAWIIYEKARLEEDHGT